MFFEPVQSLTPVSAGGRISIAGALVASTIEGKIYVCDIDSGSVRHTLEGDGESISALQLAPDRSLLIAASRSLQIHVYSMESGALIKTFVKAHESAIMTLVIDPTSTLAASGGVEGAVKCWDLRNLVCTHTLKGHGGIVSSLAFYGQLGSPDWRLASGSDNGKLIVWDLAKSQAQRTLENHTGAVTALQWTSKGDSLLSGGRDKVISVWRDLKLGATIPIHEEVVSVGTIDGSIYVATPSNVQIRSLKAEVLSSWDLESKETEVVNVIKDGDSTLFTSLSDDTIVVLQVSESQLTQEKTLSLNHGEIIDIVADSEKTALATNSKDVRVVNLHQNLLEFEPLTGHTDIVIAIDALGRWLLSGAKDKEARLWDLVTGECKAVFSGHTGSIGAVSLSRGNTDVPQFVLTGSADLTVKKWGADGNAEYTRKAHDKDINALDVAPSNRHFATGSQDRTIKVWQVDSGDVVGLLRGHKRGIWSVKFASGNTLVSGSGDKTVRMWSLNDYTCIRTFEGHLNSVLKVLVFDQQHVASAGGDGLVKLWDTKTSEAVATLDGHEDKVWSLAKTEGGDLITGGGDGVLKVWQDHTEEKQTRLEQEEEELVERQQELDNSVRAQDWDRAVRLALELNRPLRLLKLFNEVADNNEPESISGTVAVDKVLQDLDEKLLITLLERVRDWNTSGRTSIVAQTILNTLLLGPEIQKKLSNNAALKIIRGLIPFTQRHLNRTNEMIESSYALDYTISEMTM